MTGTALVWERSQSRWCTLQPFIAREENGATKIQWVHLCLSNSHDVIVASILDGVMIQITAETMDALRHALRDMKDFTITCGKAEQEDNQEQVDVQWTDDDHDFNKGWDRGPFKRQPARHSEHATNRIHCFLFFSLFAWGLSQISSLKIWHLKNSSVNCWLIN